MLNGVKFFNNRTPVEKNIHLLLHGHVHLTEDNATERLPYSKNSTFTIPCPTLTSVVTSGVRGFCVHIIGSNKSEKKITTGVWGLSTSMDFKKDGFKIRYEISINNGDVAINQSF